MIIYKGLIEKTLEISDEIETAIQNEYLEESNYETNHDYSISDLILRTNILFWSKISNLKKDSETNKLTEAYDCSNLNEIFCLLESEYFIENIGEFESSLLCYNTIYRYLPSSIIICSSENPLSELKTVFTYNKFLEKIHYFLNSKNIILIDDLSKKSEIIIEMLKKIMKKSKLFILRNKYLLYKNTKVIYLPRMPDNYIKWVAARLLIVSKESKNVLVHMGSLEDSLQLVKECLEIENYNFCLCGRFENEKEVEIQKQFKNKSFSNKSSPHFEIESLIKTSKKSHFNFSLAERNIYQKEYKEKLIDKNFNKNTSFSAANLFGSEYPKPLQVSSNNKERDNYELESEYSWIEIPGIACTSSQRSNNRETLYYKLDSNDLCTAIPGITYSQEFIESKDCSKNNKSLSNFNKKNQKEINKRNNTFLILWEEIDTILLKKYFNIEIIIDSGFKSSNNSLKTRISQQEAFKRAKTCEIAYRMYLKEAYENFSQISKYEEFKGFSRFILSSIKYQIEEYFKDDSNILLLKLLLLIEDDNSAQAINGKKKRIITKLGQLIEEISLPIEISAFLYYSTIHCCLNQAVEEGSKLFKELSNHSKIITMFNKIKRKYNLHEKERLEWKECLVKAIYYKIYRKKNESYESFFQNKNLKMKNGPDLIVLIKEKNNRIKKYLEINEKIMAKSAGEYFHFEDEILNLSIAKDKLKGKIEIKMEKNGEEYDFEGQLSDDFESMG